MTTLAATSTRSPLRRAAIALLAGALALGGVAAPALAADGETAPQINYRVESSIDLTGKTLRTALPYRTDAGATGVVAAYADGGASATTVIVADHDSLTLEQRSSYAIEGAEPSQGGRVIRVEVSPATGNHVVLRSNGVEVRDPSSGAVLGDALIGTATAVPLEIAGDGIWFQQGANHVRYSEQAIIAGAEELTASITVRPGAALVDPISGALLILRTGTLTSYDAATGAQLAQRSLASGGATASNVRRLGDDLYAQYARVVDGAQVSGFAKIDPSTLAPVGEPVWARSLAYMGLFPGHEGGFTIGAVDISTVAVTLRAVDPVTLIETGEPTVLPDMRSSNGLAAVYDPTTSRVLVAYDTGLLAYAPTTDELQPPDDGIDYGDAIVGKAARGGSLTWGIKDSWRTYMTSGHASSSATITLEDGIAENGAGTYDWPGTEDATAVYDAESGEFRVVYDGAIHYYAYAGALNMRMQDPTIVVRETEAGPVGTLYVSSAIGTDVPVATLDLSTAQPTVSEADGATTVSYAEVPATYLADTGSHFFLSFYEDRVALDPLSFSFTVSNEDARWVPVGATDPGSEEPEPPVTEEPGEPEQPGTEQPAEPTEGVTLEWSGSAELQAAPPFGGSNYFTAGVSDGTEATYRTTDGDVAVVRDIGGDRTTPSYGTRGEHVGRGSQVAVFSEGVLTEHEAGGLSVAWDGALSINFYGGLVPFTLSDPVLEIAADGTGELVADLSGYASDMANPTVKVPTEARNDVTVATFSGVDLEAADGYTITPHYAGVEVSTAASTTATPQNRTVSGWGAWPQEFVDYQLGTGLSSYWYSSGGAADSRKAPFPFAVALNGNGPGAEVPVVHQPTPIAPPAVQAPPAQQPAPAPAPAAAPQAAPAGALPVAAEAPRILPADSAGLLAELEAGTIALVPAAEAGIEGELEAGSTVELDLAWEGEDAAGTVWAYSTPVEAGSFAVADARATGAVDLAGLEPGEHHLVLSGDAGTVVAVPITIAETEAVAALAAEPRQDVAAEATPISAPAASDPLWFVAAGLGGALLIVLLVGILLATGVLRLAPARTAAHA